MSLFATLPAEERELFFLQHQQGRGIGPVIAETNLGCWLMGRIFSQRSSRALACLKVARRARRCSMQSSATQDIHLVIIPSVTLLFLRMERIRAA